MSENKLTVNGTTTIKRHKIIILKRREIVCTLKLCVIVDHWYTCLMASKFPQFFYVLMPIKVNFYEGTLFISKWKWL